MNASVITLSASPLSFDWGIDGMVLWIEESYQSPLAGRMPDVMDRIAFSIELQTGWDYRDEQSALHLLFGFRLLLRDASGLWHAIRTSPTGHFIELVPLEELDYVSAYEKIMCLE